MRYTGFDGLLVSWRCCATAFRPNICDALRELPETLDITYERILLEIKPGNREHTHRLL
jgi:hypothetical protein